MNVISLFSGIGGIDLGLERAGMTVVAHSEIEPWPCEVLAHHWPSVPNLGDITKIDWSGWVGTDVIAGGFPCQDLSVAGKQAGLSGERSGLWSEYARAIREVRPRYAIIENVPGLLSADTGGAFSTVLGDLAALGYDAWWDCIPASAVGAPHRRDRVFIVATRADVKPYDTSVEPIKWAIADTDNDGSPARAVTGSNGSGDDNQQDGADGTTNATGGNSGRSIRPRSLANRTETTGRIATDPERERQPRQGRPLDTLSTATGRDRETSLPEYAGRWRVEPDVGRVANGVPNRVAKLKGLGNAVVPQVAQYVGEQVMIHGRKDVAQ